jgi:hypothetical protein
MNGTKKMLIQMVRLLSYQHEKLTIFLAEDNPANDYPEDEVSSGDEFGVGAYDHRRNASDDEEYDFDRDQ